MKPFQTPGFPYHSAQTAKQPRLPLLALMIVGIVTLGLLGEHTALGQTASNGSILNANKKTEPCSCELCREIARLRNELSPPKNTNNGQVKAPWEPRPNIAPPSLPPRTEPRIVPTPETSIARKPAPVVRRTRRFDYFILPSLGVAFPRDAQASHSTAGTLTLKRDPGLSVGIAGGIRWGNTSLGLGVNHYRAGNDSLHISGASLTLPAGGSIGATAFHLSLTQDIPLSARFGLLAGASLGLTHLSNKLEVSGSGNNKDESSFGASLLAGMRFRITENNDLRLAYRYLHTSDEGAFTEAKAHELGLSLQTAF